MIMDAAAEWRKIQELTTDQDMKRKKEDEKKIFRRMEQRIPDLRDCLRPD